MQENVHRKSAQEKLRREEMHRIYTKKNAKKILIEAREQKKCTKKVHRKFHRKNAKKK